MLVLLVRHGHAGSKASWRGDDRLRPLSARGAEEAAALVDILRPYGPVRVVSSPLLRCVQTVEPLATALGVPVEQSARLGPESPKQAAGFLRDLAEGPGPVVACTHGEVIEVVQAGYPPRRVRGAKATARAKGSTWVLEYAGRRLRSARYLPAPRIGAVPAAPVAAAPIEATPAAATPVAAAAGGGS
ncbi:MAG TPA: phosphoglycerate mutase family protein [Acidimicrobiales bacterium]|nr:phosphoglycerate mutase family protein [Acidimicrobiales bacterium]